jgi:hypothetical protein
MSSTINPDNWTFSFFELGSFKAFISFGVDFSETEPSNNENSFVYYVTVLEKGEKTIFQKKYLNLEDACKMANHKYRLWTWKQATEGASQDGCHNCKAH